MPSFFFIILGYVISGRILFETRYIRIWYVRRTQMGNIILGNVSPAETQFEGANGLSLSEGATGPTPSRLSRLVMLIWFIWGTVVISQSQESISSALQKLYCKSYLDCYCSSIICPEADDNQSELIIEENNKN